jgi:hypothetical protein
VLAITDEDAQALRVQEETKDKGWTRRLRILITGPASTGRRIFIRYRVVNAFRFVNASSPIGRWRARWADGPVCSRGRLA